METLNGDKRPKQKKTAASHLPRPNMAATVAYTVRGAVRRRNALHALLFDPFLYSVALFLALRAEILCAHDGRCWCWC